jgi:phytoene dehydrogenase-like protein
MLEYAIVGAGVGGVFTAKALESRDIILFEKEPNLGGCAGSFVRNGVTYNIGATTFAPYQEGLPLYEFCKRYSIELNLKKSENAMVVRVGDKTINRYRDFDSFIDELDRAFQYKKNREFFTYIKSISDRFYREVQLYYLKHTFTDRVKSLFSLSQLLLKFPKELLLPARYVIESYFPDIERDYLEFLDNQIYIVAQAKSDEVSFLVASLALSYTLYDNYYSEDMGSIFRDVLKDFEKLQKRERVREIEILSDKSFLLRTKKAEYHSKRVILNSTVFDSASLFKSEKVKRYFNSFAKSYNSAFVLYLHIKANYSGHYQLISDRYFSYSSSNSIFVSFAKESVTISTHTTVKEFESEVKAKREVLKAEILEFFGSHFSDIEILSAITATPKSFYKHILRSSLGGNALTYRNMLFSLASVTTDIENLYQVGDSVFPAQGFAGVIEGVNMLLRHLEDK